jgi:Holin of 3TMs, for gene-transfer release
MLTLFASIVGFMGSVVPEVLRLVRDKADKEHELKILEKQIENSRISLSNLQEIEAGTIERKIMYKTYKTKIKWVDALNGTVRPMLAYGFFAFYVLMKLRCCSIASYVSLMSQIENIWTDNDYAIFAGVISFYFGQRTFSKLRQQ